MTAPTAGLVQVKVFVRFSVVLVRFMRVRTRLPWVFDEITIFLVCTTEIVSGIKLSHVATHVANRAHRTTSNDI